MNLSIQEYEKLKNKTHKEYQKIKEVYCPELKQKVSFNSQGFFHLIYKNRKNKREISTVVFRFKLLDKVKKLLGETTTIQEYDSFTRETMVEDHNLKIAKILKTEYFGYIAIIDGWKIKVIVKKIGNGNPFFWSVIPNWITNRRDKGKKYVNFKGNLEED